MKFNERLKALREDKDLTQTELSKKLHISRSTLANYEQGRREPTIELEIALANFFNVSLDYLLCRFEDRQ